MKKQSPESTFKEVRSYFRELEKESKKFQKYKNRCLTNYGFSKSEALNIFSLDRYKTSLEIEFIERALRRFLKNENLKRPDVIYMADKIHQSYRDAFVFICKKIGYKSYSIAKVVKLSTMNINTIVRRVEDKMLLHYKRGYYSLEHQIFNKYQNGI